MFIYIFQNNGIASIIGMWYAKCHIFLLDQSTSTMIVWTQITYVDWIEAVVEWYISSLNLK